MFLMQLLLDPLVEKLQATATTSQYLVEGAHCSVEVQATHSPLSNCTQGFEAVFTKEDFNILLEHHCWNHTIGLLLGLEPKSSQVYSLFLVEQRELNIFLEENLWTRCIGPSKSLIVALVFFIKKKNSFFHLVQDY